MSAHRRLGRIRALGGPKSRIGAHKTTLTNVPLESRANSRRMEILGPPNPAGDRNGHGPATLSVGVERMVPNCGRQEEETPTKEAGQRRRVMRAGTEVVDADVRELWAQCQAAWPGYVGARGMSPTRNDAIERRHGVSSAHVTVRDTARGWVGSGWSATTPGHVGREMDGRIRPREGMPTWVTDRR